MGVALTPIGHACIEVARQQIATLRRQEHLERLREQLRSGTYEEAPALEAAIAALAREIESFTRSRAA